MPTPLERLQYGYDRDSRRVWRRRALASGEDNHYGYDGLSQVTASALGNLNQNQTAIAAVPAELESFDYDPTGNWRGYRVEADGAVSLEQQRVHDKGNRLTQIEEEESPILLDRVGRMTEMAPDASGDWHESLKLKWDAWSRITEVRRASDDEVLGSYTYDGLTRRITRTVAGTTVHSYYSDSWRPLEERKDDETTASAQYFWGARHRDDLVRRDRDTTGGGTLDETRYVLMDYFSPASITDETGAVTERYAFSTFGVRRILAPDFSPRSTSECAFEFAFQGQFLDSESGLLNYGYRYYSPFLGRWTAKDPIEEWGGLNLYGMANNGIVNSVDFLGLDEVTRDKLLKDLNITDPQIQKDVDKRGCSGVACSQLMPKPSPQMRPFVPPEGYPNVNCYSTQDAAEAAAQKECGKNCYALFHAEGKFRGNPMLDPKTGKYGDPGFFGGNKNEGDYNYETRPAGSTSWYGANFGQGNANAGGQKFFKGDAPTRDKESYPDEMWCYQCTKKKQ